LPEFRTIIGRKTLRNEWFGVNESLMGTENGIPNSAKRRRDFHCEPIMALRIARSAGENLVVYQKWYFKWRETLKKVLLCSKNGTSNGAKRRRINYGNLTCGVGPPVGRIQGVIFVCGYPELKPCEAP